MPKVKIFNIIVTSKSNGVKITTKQLATMNGPNGIYSFTFFLLIIKIPILIIAANKKASTEIMIILIQPKNKPSAPMNFTSPKPIASFPAINPPIKVMSKKIPPPASIPKMLSVSALMPLVVSNSTVKKVKTSPCFKYR